MVPGTRSHRNLPPGDRLQSGKRAGAPPAQAVSPRGCGGPTRTRPPLPIARAPLCFCRAHPPQPSRSLSALSTHRLGSRRKCSRTAGARASMSATPRSRRAFRYASAVSPFPRRGMRPPADMMAPEDGGRARRAVGEPRMVGAEGECETSKDINGRRERETQKRRGVGRRALRVRARVRVGLHSRSPGCGRREACACMRGRPRSFEREQTLL